MIKDYITLCKPKVVLLMLISAWVGMHLAAPHNTQWSLIVFGTIGIALAASSAAVINHLVDRHIDGKMSRTAMRPLVNGRVTPKSALIFSAILGILSLIIMLTFANPVATLLTFISLLGYAVIYTMFLKRATSQNIVIGGLAGAMPPLLGWSTVSGNITPESLLLVLIIFIWTPPHFWSLAIYRCEDYAKANIPMLPVTHGIQFTKLFILLYTILLFPITTLPYLINMSGIIYLATSFMLNCAFLYYVLRMYSSQKKYLAMQTFNYSTVYLLLLFSSLLIDHYVLSSGGIAWHF